jgi:hypothetical protein
MMLVYDHTVQVLGIDVLQVPPEGYCVCCRLAKVQDRQPGVKHPVDIMHFTGGSCWGSDQHHLHCCVDTMLLRRGEACLWEGGGACRCGRP